MWDVAPILAGLVEVGLTEHILVSTRSGYESAIRSYVDFLKAFHGPPPFPADGIWLCAWIAYICMDISVPSLKVYLSGIKYGQGCHGSLWTLDGDERLRRMLRWVKKRYGSAGKATKVPLSLRLLSRIFSFIPGWPSLRRMSHDDRVYVAASVVATLGFLRGGEFTWSKGSCRRMLLGADLQVISSLGSPAVRVSIPRPKTRWWLPSVSVTCFQPASGCFLDPAWLVNGMRNLAPAGASMGPSDAAFRMTNGAPLSRSVAVTRTTELMTAANVQLLDHRGEPMDVKAASWRAGGVASAKEAGLSDAVIMEMGRWTSPAWLHYSVTNLHDVRDAMRSMWVAACAPDILAGGHVVGVSAPADASDNDVVAQAQSLLASSNRSSYRRATG
jgi:hypothetical protein